MLSNHSLIRAAGLRCHAPPPVPETVPTAPPEVPTTGPDVDPPEIIDPVLPREHPAIDEPGQVPPMRMGLH